MGPKTWDDDDEPRKPDPHDSALSVGTNNMGDTAKMRELEDELHDMTDKVASASLRFADYENNIRVLTAELRLAKKRNDSLDSTAATESAKQQQQQQQLQQQAATAAATATAPVAGGGLSRFGSFMHSRKSSAAPVSSAPKRASTPTARERELESLLAQSQAQHLAAETKVHDMSMEIEELTGTLFSQANEMVAEERREGARLRERIRFLEERDAKFAMKVSRVEERDRERKKRLERLERGMARIERVKGVLVHG